MSSILDIAGTLNLPKVTPPVVPGSVAMVAERLGLTITLTSPSVPEQYSVERKGQPAGHIHVRHFGMSIDYPDVGGDRIYEGPVDGFGGFTDHERETQLLFALGLIAARIMAA